MTVRMTPLRETAGVLLTRCDEVSVLDRVVTSYFRISTLRPNQPSVLAREEDAHKVFELEVIASLSDPVALKTSIAGRSRART